MSKIIFITGASGVGKTALVEHLKNKYITLEWKFIHFDSIGVPSVETMTKEYGSPLEWQKAMTYKWIDKLIHNYNAEYIVFEGQVNLQFIKEGFKLYDFSDYQIVLLDCSEEEMAYRLTHKRNQPELLNDDMRNWLKFLRNQSKEYNVAKLDTTELIGPELIEEFEKLIKFGK